MCIAIYIIIIYLFITIMLGTELSSNAAFKFPTFDIVNIHIHTINKSMKRCITRLSISNKYIHAHMHSRIYFTS